MMSRDRLSAANWARTVLQQNPLILDTETTGLEDAELCQIAIIDLDGNPLLDTLVKPTRPIPPGATRIHGITDQMVADAPDFMRLSVTLGEMLYHRTVVVYNAAYDVRIIYRSHELARVQECNYWTLATWHCAMERYATFYGDWNEYRGSFRWQKLTFACQNEHIPDPVAPAHSALGDCLRTLALVRKMAQAADEAVPT